MKNEKGITLIALVITIIVLLILAGVTIAMLTGENGILGRATESRASTKITNAEEIIAVNVVLTYELYAHVIHENTIIFHAITTLFSYELVNLTSLIII